MTEKGAFCCVALKIFLISHSFCSKGEKAHCRKFEKLFSERDITGRELTVAILDGEALPAVEIRPKVGFYDYANKYQGSTEELCPAPIPKETADRLAKLCLDAFRVLRLRQYARFDVMLDEDGELYILEANTLPGMTPTSLLPLSAQAAGISYGELCERLIGLPDAREG